MLDDDRTFADHLAFLRRISEECAADVVTAGQLAYEAPDAAMIALRRFVERVARDVLGSAGLGRRAAVDEILSALRERGEVPVPVLDAMDDIRVLGNRGAHPLTREAISTEHAPLCQRG